MNDLTLFLKNEISLLQQTLNDTKLKSLNETNELKKALEAKEEEISQVKLIQSKLKNENELLNELNDKLKLSFKSKEEEFKDLRGEFNQLQETLFGKCEELEKENLRLNKQLQNSVSKISNADEILNLHSSAELSTNLLSTFTELQNLQVKYDQMEENFQQLNHQHQLLQNDFDILFNDYESVKYAASFQKENQKLQQELKWYQQSNSDLSKQLSHLLEQRNSNALSDVSNHVSNSSAYSSNSEDLEDLIDSGLVKFDSLQDLLEKNAKMIGIIRQLSKKLEGFEKETSSVSTQTNSIETLEYEALLVEYNNFKQSSTNQINDLKAEIEKTNSLYLKERQVSIKLDGENKAMEQRFELMKQVWDSNNQEIARLREEKNKERNDRIRLEEKLSDALTKANTLIVDKNVLDHQAQQLKSRLDVLEKESHELKSERKEMIQERSQLLSLIVSHESSPKPVPSETTSNAKYELLLKDYQLLHAKYENEKGSLERELDRLKEEIKAEEEKRKDKNVVMELLNYRNQAETMSKLSKEYEEKYLNMKQSYEKLEQELSAKQNDLIENLSTIASLQKQLDSLETCKTEYEKKISTLNGNLDNLLKDLQRAKQDISESNSNYENELIKHAKNLELLQQLKVEINELRMNKSILLKESEDRQLKLEELQRKLEVKDKEFKETTENIEERIKLTRHENEKLKQDILNGSVSEQTLLSIRNDMNILELENQQLKITNSRLEQELVSVGAEVKHAISFQKQQQNNASLPTLDLLKESNEMLRNENKKIEEELKECKIQYDSLSKTNESLQTTILKLNSELKFCNEKIELIEIDNEKWKKRNEQIISKYNQVDPDELIRLENENKRLDSELHRFRTENGKVNEELQKILDENSKMINEFHDLKAILTEKDKQLQSLREKESNLKLLVENLKKDEEKKLKYDEIKEELSKVEQEKNESLEKMQKYIAAGKKWKEKFHEAESELGKEKEKLKSAEEKLDKAVESHKVEIERTRQELELRSKVKISVYENMVKKMENVNKELMSKIETAGKRIREEDESFENQKSFKIKKVVTQEVVKETAKEDSEVSDEIPSAPITTQQQAISIVEALEQEEPVSAPVVIEPEESQDQVKDPEETVVEEIRDDSASQVQELEETPAVVEEPTPMESIEASVTTQHDMENIENNNNEKDEEMEEDISEEESQHTENEMVQANQKLSKSITEETEPEQDFTKDEEIEMEEYFSDNGKDTNLKEEEPDATEKSISQIVVQEQEESSDTESSEEGAIEEDEEGEEERTAATLESAKTPSTNLAPEKVIVTSSGTVIPKITFEAPSSANAKVAVDKKPSTGMPTRQSLPATIGRGRGVSAAAFLQSIQQGTRGRGQRKGRGKK